MMYLNKRIPVNRHQHLFLHAVRKQTSAFPVDDRLALCSQWIQRPGHRLQTLSVTSVHDRSELVCGHRHVRRIRGAEIVTT